MIHDLKTHPEPFSATRHGQKRFEFRLNDRNFKVADRLRLMEWDPIEQKYTGQVIERCVTCIIEAPMFGIPEGYCVMSLV